jgi:hypothetical protein
VTNYFKTYRLVYEDILEIDEIKLGRFSWTTFHLKAQSSFGKQITFLKSNPLFNTFCIDHPEVGSMLKEKYKKK